MLPLTSAPLIPSTDIEPSFAVLSSTALFNSSAICEYSASSSNIYSPSHVGGYLSLPTPFSQFSITFVQHMFAFPRYCSSHALNWFWLIPSSRPNVFHLALTLSTSRNVFLFPFLSFHRKRCRDPFEREPNEQ